MEYSGAINVSATETLKAIATASGYGQSATGQAVYAIGAAIPTFSPAAGTYTSTQTVTISDATTGATIYYTTNGTTPTTASSVYSSAITVSATETLEAIATASGYSQSVMGSAVYTIQVATPTFSLAAGTYISAQTVTISDATTGATIYYTTNGTTPTTASTTYSSTITVSATETLKAIGTYNGETNSAVDSAVYTIQAATPAFSPAAGTYTSVQTVTISDATTGVTVYYTTNGTTPTTNSTTYSAPITVSASETLEAIAAATGLSNSSTDSAIYTINLPPAATPTFSPVAGTYIPAQTVTISDSTSSATIYYTTNGSAPTTSSSIYSSAITVSVNETLEAIATASGYSQSAMGSAAYSINPAAKPIFSQAAGTYTTVQTVTISDSTTGATVYYTTDGSMPTTTATVYSGVITVSSTEMLEAVAIASGYSLSPVELAAYTINLPAATPTFSPGTGTYTAAQTVTISDSTSGATIYYTTDGTTPTLGSSVYGSPISVSSSETVEAIATASDYSPSAAAEAIYTLEVEYLRPTASSGGSLTNVCNAGANGGASAMPGVYQNKVGVGPISSGSGEVGAEWGEVGLGGQAYAQGLFQNWQTSNNSSSYTALTINVSTDDLIYDGGSASIQYSPDAGSTWISMGSLSGTQNTLTATITGTTLSNLEATNLSDLKVLACAESSSINEGSSVSVDIYDIWSAGSCNGTCSTPPTSTPSFSPAAGTYTSGQTVAISDSAIDATIYYTTDGTTPTTNSTAYSAPIAVGTTQTVSAIAIVDGYSQSAVGSAAYDIALPITATPAFAPGAGSYTTAQTVTISDSTGGAAIYYTTNGTTPTTNSAVYSAPITVGATETVSAIAIVGGYSQSAVGAAAYAIDEPITATPAFAPGAGSYTTAQTVTISDSTSGATIYYTTNGTTPMSSSSVYSGAIPVSANETVEVMAMAAGYLPSAVGSAAYGIGVTPTLTLTTSGTPSLYGGLVTFTATISPSGPSGTVTFNDNGMPISGSTISLSGTTTAVYATTSLPSGTNSITASYSGDSSFTPVTSNTITQTVTSTLTTCW